LQAVLEEKFIWAKIQQSQLAERMPLHASYKPLGKSLRFNQLRLTYATIFEGTSVGSFAESYITSKDC
jgi:hypothetical protein